MSDDALRKALERINTRLSPNPDLTVDDIIRDVEWAVAEARAALASPPSDVVGEIVAWLRKMGRERVLITNAPKLRNPLKLADEISRRFGGGENGWRSIESAPKDGTLVDLWSPRLGRLSNCRWQKYLAWSDKPESEMWSVEGRGGFPLDIAYPPTCRPDAQPTHWRPLPPPPEDKP